MKKILMLLFIITSVPKVAAQQEELAPWILNLDKEIENFNERTKIKKEVVDTVNNVKTKTVWYKKKKKISKIKILFYYLEAHPAEFTYYLKNETLLKYTISGVLPKTQKEKKEFYIFDDITYFKNKEKAFKQSKNKRLKDVNAFYASYVELLKLTYTIKEFEANESKKEYDRVYHLIGGLRIY